MTEFAQWEYRLETFGSYWGRPKDDDLQAALDEWGADGWEVINIYPASSGEKISVVAKRQLGNKTRRQRSWPE